MAFTNTSNVSLPKPIDRNLLMDDFPEYKAAHNLAMNTLETVLGGSVVISTNPSIVNVQAARIVKLYACSAGSISTITGMLRNVPFTMVMISSGASLALLDAGAGILSANWIPDTQYDNITLVWDGTNYIEVGRVAA